MIKKSVAIAIVASAIGVLGWMLAGNNPDDGSTSARVSSDSESLNESDAGSLEEPDSELSSAEVDRPATWKSWSTLQRLKFDFEHNGLTADDYLVLGVRSIVDPESLPPQYQAESIARNPSQATVYEYLKVWDQASPEAQQEASDLMNDPTTWGEDGSDPRSSESSSGDVQASSTYSQSFAKGHFSITWSTPAEDPVYGLPSTPDNETWFPGAVPSGVMKPRKNRVPDFVDRVHFALEEAYQDYIAMGYRTPTSSVINVRIGDPPCPGGCDGYVVPVPFHTIYLAPPPTESREEPATDAEFYLPRHELFHHFQYQYKWDELLADGVDYDWWWLEATAEWAAHKSNFITGVYPDQVRLDIEGDNFRYIDQLPTAMALTADRLSTCATFEPECYGDFIFAEFLEERFGTETIREVWEEMGGPSFPNALEALQTVLGRNSSSLDAALPQYARSIYTISESSSFTDSPGDQWGKQHWLNALQGSPSTARDELGEPRPIRDTEYIRSDAIATGTKVIQPGGIHYVDLALDPSVANRSAWASLTVTGDLQDVNLELVPFSSHPSTCLAADIRSTGSGYLFRLGATCDSATLIITHTDPMPLTASGAINWAVQLTPYVGPLEDGPLGYWRLGETTGATAFDLSGNSLHGSYLHGWSPTPRGAIRNDSDGAAALNPSGWTGGVEIGHTPLLDTANLTAEAWARTLDSSSTDVESIIGHSGSFNLGLQENRAFGSITVGGSEHVVKGGPRVNEGAWHHFALTYDGSLLRLFVDGNQVDDEPVTGAMAPSSQQPLRLGSQFKVVTNFAGDIDEAALFGRALPAATFQERFTKRWSPTPQCEGNGPYTQLVCDSKPFGYWRLGENAGPTMNDFTKIQDGFYLSGLTFGRQGAIADNPNSATGFASTTEAGGVISYEPYGSHAAKELTAEAWTRTTRDNVGWGPSSIIGRPNAFNLGTLNNKAYGKVTIAGIHYELTGGDPINEGAWHHVALTFDGTAARLFVDGVRVDEKAISGQLSNSQNETMRIGSQWDRVTHYIGDLDEVALYDRALTQADFAARFEHRWTLEGDCSPSSAYTQLVCAADPVGYWRLGEAIGPIMFDFTKIQNGSYGGGLFFGRTGAIANDPNTAASFSSTTDAGAVIPYEEYGSHAARTMTAEAWVRTTRNNSGWGVSSIIGRPNAFNLGVLENKASGQITIGGLVYDVTGGQAINDGAWHHVALTFDGTTVRLFVDGAAVDQKAALGPLFNNPAETLRVGSQWKIVTHYVGDLDEIALYDRALTQEEFVQRWAHRAP